MRISLLIYAAAPSAQGPSTALRFARAALAAGHDIQQVFFYGDGVYCLNAMACPAGDEADCGKDWARLSRQHGFEMIACSASAQRRGVLNADAARRLQKPGPSLHDAAESGGLGALVEACQTSERLVSFL